MVPDGLTDAPPGGHPPLDGDAAGAGNTSWCVAVADGSLTFSRSQWLRRRVRGARGEAGGSLRRGGLQYDGDGRRPISGAALAAGGEGAAPANGPWSQHHVPLRRRKSGPWLVP